MNWYLINDDLLDEYKQAIAAYVLARAVGTSATAMVAGKRFIEAENAIYECEVEEVST